jgi:EF hand
MTDTFKRKAITLAFAPALALSSAALYAAGEQHEKQQQRSQSSMTDPVKKQTFSALDGDNDGTLSMMEAAADPDAKQQFKQLDTNNDYKLSRSEYERLEQVSKETVGGSSGAATGGTTQGGQQEQDKSWVEKSKQTYDERSK